MSLLVTGIRLPFDEPETAALDRARRLTGLLSSETEAAVCRVSIDARRGQISRVYSVRLDAPCDEKALAEKLQMPSVRYKENVRPAVPHGEKRLAHRPVVVGLGPAGLFAAYTLARHGFRPIVLERGGDMDERDRAVDTFWSGGALDPDCNIQFGEGGAGAYSDGKLTTRIGDALCETVLETLAAHGAPADIVKKAKPHVGTDILKDVVREMRREIVKNGGEVHFRTALTGVSLKNGALTAVRADGMDIPCERAIIAVGHSARDTFLALHENGVYFEPKAFSVGVRIEHLQSELDRALYGKFAGHPLLPPQRHGGEGAFPPAAGDAGRIRLAGQCARAVPYAGAGLSGGGTGVPAVARAPRHRPARGRGPQPGREGTRGGRRARRQGGLSPADRSRGL